MAIKVESDSLNHGERVPDEHAFGVPDGSGGAAAEGGNRSPHLRWSGHPEGTESFALIVFDPDVPADATDVNQEGKTLPEDAAARGLRPLAAGRHPGRRHRAPRGRRLDRDRRRRQGPGPVRARRRRRQQLHRLPRRRSRHGGHLRALRRALPALQRRAPPPLPLRRPRARRPQPRARGRVQARRRARRRSRATCSTRASWSPPTRSTRSCSSGASAGEVDARPSSELASATRSSIAASTSPRSTSLDRRVHVAQRDRDEPGRDPGAGDLVRVGVGPGPATRRPRPCTRSRPTRPSRRAARRRFGDRVEPRPITGPGPERVRARLLLLDSRGVGGVGDVDDDRDVGLAAGRPRCAPPWRPISSWTAATPATSAVQPAALVAATRDLERDVGAEPVVQRARDQPARRRARSGSASDHDRIADPQQLERLVAVGGADVDVQAVELDRLLLLLVLQQVDRLAADHPGDDAVAGLHLDPLADQDLRVPAADRQEPGEALLVDVGDRQPDLVDVADDRDQRPVAGAGDAGDRGADPVGLELGERRRRRATPAPPAPRSPRAKGCAAACREALERPPLPRHPNGDRVAG